MVLYIKLICFLMCFAWCSGGPVPSLKILSELAAASPPALFQGISMLLSRLPAWQVPYDEVTPSDYNCTMIKSIPGLCGTWKLVSGLVEHVIHLCNISSPSPPVQCIHPLLSICAVLIICIRNIYPGKISCQGSLRILSYLQIKKEHESWKYKIVICLQNFPVVKIPET